MNLTKYNSADSLLVISPYPSRGTTHTGGGIASYTKNTLLAIKKADPGKKIVVLANIVEKEETYLEEGILIVRCWDRSFFRFFPQVLSKLAKFSTVREVLFEFEFAAYGDLLTASLIPLLLGCLRLNGRTVVSVVHQVIENLSELATHTGLTGHKNKLHFFNTALAAFYRLLVFLSNTVITLEEPLAERLRVKTGGTNIIAIPHGLYRKNPLKRSAALKRLNLDRNNYYVLAFGYLSHYKGSDLIVEAFQKPIKVNGKTVKLILAGGESPTQGQKNHYRGFYKKLYQKIDNKDNIIHTGFVPDSRIRTYFSAADLTVFPYRTFMSASGPLSLALSFGKPLIVSQAIAHYGQLNFDNRPATIRQTIASVIRSHGALRANKQETLLAAKSRDFNFQGEKYLEAFQPTRNEQPSLLLNYSK